MRKLFGFIKNMAKLPQMDNLIPHQSLPQREKEAPPFSPLSWERGLKRLSAPEASKKFRGGFTLIELVVVMAIIATLLTIAAPRYIHSVEKSREAVLRQNLSLTREALDKYYGDNGKYPDSLADLASKKYLRSLPLDPITGDATTWLIVPPDMPGKGGVFDIRSGAPGKAPDGSEYKDW